MILNLINDLLDLAKIENSSFKLNWTYFNIFEIIEKTAETLDSQLYQKKIMMTHEYHEEDKPYFL
jgi:signal transduction histidine kinase